MNREKNNPQLSSRAHVAEMFSFFRRNKTKPIPPSDNNNDANKTSVNMQLAIERQQASLQQTLELRRKNDVNDRERQAASSHTANVVDDDDRRGIFSSPMLASECDQSNVLASRASASQKQQNYDQYRDARRSSSALFDSVEFAGRQGKAPPPIDCNQFPSARLSSPTAVAVASPFTDPRCSPTSAGTDSSNAYNSVFEVMARGRNRNKHRGAPSPPQNQHKSFTEKVSKSANDSRDEVTSENSMGGATNVGRAPNNPNNSSASAGENSEKSTSSSIPSENVFHDENSSGSINSRGENKNDNITATSDGARVAASSGGVKNESSAESAAASGVKNDEEAAAQQVAGAPLQRSLSAKRVTFAPSPPRSVASSLSDEEDDEEEATTSEDIFYEAAEAQDTQKLRILSTITSLSSDCKRIDEETSELDESSSCGESSYASLSKSASNDVVCAKIILSVNDNGEKSKLSDNDDDSIKLNAFSNDATSISTAPKTIKQTYLDGAALPDIVAETSLFEQLQHQHLPDEK